MALCATLDINSDNMKNTYITITRWVGHISLFYIDPLYRVCQSCSVQARDTTFRVTLPHHTSYHVRQRTEN